MAISRYLAMTDTEFSISQPASWTSAWMACHFSPYDTGLTNLPQKLPRGTLLILNDRIPPMHCDIGRIYVVLEQFIHTQGCSGLLLDFQRKDCSQLNKICQKLIGLNCPVAVSLPYAKELSCPVFLPPVPILTTPADYLSCWKGREIWLEISLNSTRITLDMERSKTETVPCINFPLPFRDENLLCHYKLALSETNCVFYLQRTRQDLDELLDKAGQFGVTTAVGLWQELK